MLNPQKHRTRFTQTPRIEVRGPGFNFTHARLWRFHERYNEANAHDNLLYLYEMAKNSNDWKELPNELKTMLNQYIHDLKSVVELLAHEDKKIKKCL